MHAPKIALRIHLTRIPGPLVTEGVSDASWPRGGSEESGGASSSPPMSTYAKDSDREPEKDGIMSDSERSTAPSIVGDLPLAYGRPDTAGLIRAAVQSMSKDQRVLIAACGPTSLIELVRTTTASCIRSSGPAVELHCEEFGW